MLTQGEDVEVHALARRGWSISAIARHLGRDRKTVRAYVEGVRTPGVRRRPDPDPPRAAIYGAAFFLTARGQPGTVEVRRVLRYNPGWLLGL